MQLLFLQALAALALHAADIEFCCLALAQRGLLLVGALNFMNWLKGLGVPGIECHDLPRRQKLAASPAARAMLPGTKSLVALLRG